MARIKEIDRVGQGRRKRRPVIYLVCEGEETEIIYFKHFRTRNSGIDIIPVPSKQKSAVGLVRKAEKSLGDKDFFPDLGDKLWCVFDCDANTNDDLIKAKAMAKQKGYEIAFSNPCIEIWFLFHFLLPGSPLLNCEAVIDVLEKKTPLKNYKKSQDVFKVLQPLINEALSRVDKRRSKLDKEHIEELSRESNPFTNIDILVRYLMANR